MDGVNKAYQYSICSPCSNINDLTDYFKRALVFDYAWHKITEVKSGEYNSASVRRTNPASWEQITN